MDRKQEIIDVTDRIIGMNKSEWSSSEIAILIQSQYYNIKDMFAFGANYTENDTDMKIRISEEIISVCNSFYHNLKLYPSILSWHKREDQIERINGIFNEISKSLTVQKAIKRFKDDPSHFNAMQLKTIMNNQ